MSTFLYVLVFLFAGLDIFLFFKNVEYAYCAVIRGQPPFVPSSKYSRCAVGDVIRNNYPDTKLVCEIGSGFGGLSRYIARKCNCDVIGLENMPFAAIVSWLGNSFCPSVRTVYSDAFKYLADTDKIFDVAIAYLGPGHVSKLLRYKKHFRVLITLDFEISEKRPVRVIDVGRGMTRYNGVMYPHRLFIYEFGK